MSLLLSALARFILRLVGWRIDTPLPDTPKMVVVAAYHTSNLDGVLMLLIAFALRIRIRFLAKHTLFRPPFGGVLRALGAIPVNRSASEGVVEQAAAYLRAADSFILVLSPEGTRRKVTRWKRGFFEIARAANVPIVLGGLDYAGRRLKVGVPFMPASDIEQHLDDMRAFYADVTPRFPDRAGTITFSRTANRADE